MVPSPHQALLGLRPSSDGSRLPSTPSPTSSTHDTHAHLARMLDTEYTLVSGPLRPFPRRHDHAAGAERAHTRCARRAPRRCGLWWSSELASLSESRSPSAAARRRDRGEIARGPTTRSQRDRARGRVRLGEGCVGRWCRRRSRASAADRSLPPRTARERPACASRVGELRVCRPLPRSRL